jgi:hypothetical protein
LQVTDTPPAGSTYRLFPSTEGWQTGTAPDYQAIGDTDGYTIGNTFQLAAPCTMLKLWFLSASGCTSLPTRCGVWDVTTEAIVAGTDNPSPSWLAEGGGAASPGGGWVWCDYSSTGIVLPAGRPMIVSAFNAGPATWRGVSLPFWGTGGISSGPAINLGAHGLNYGVISAPSTAGGVPLQGGFNGPGTPWGFPGNWNNPENDWTDIEVAPFTSPVSANLSASVSLAAAGTIARRGAASLAAPGSIGSAGILTRRGGAALSAPAALAAAGTRRVLATAALPGLPVLSAAALLARHGSAALAGAGALAAVPESGTVRPGAAALSASPSLSCSYLTARITLSAITMFPDKDQGIYGPSGDSSTVVVPGVIDGVFDT